MGYKDSMNPYQAFNMNPANFSDPMGLLSIKQWFFGVSEGGANTIMGMGLSIGKKFAMYLMPERAKEIAGFSIHFNFTDEDKPIVTASIDREMTVGKMFVEDLKNMTLVIPAGKSLGNLIGNTIVGFNPNYSQELRDEFQMEAARGIAPTVASVSSLFFLTKGITAKANSYFYKSVNSPKLMRMNLLEGEAKFSGRLPHSIKSRLQRHVDRAVREVDALGDEAFTPRQAQVVQRHPYLRPAFRGNRIDVRARGYIEMDPNLSHLKSNYTNGPDFVCPNTGRWWDMTTPRQWQAHVKKYGANGTLLSTQR